MKLACIKLGARIAKGGTSGGSGEALAILELLSKHNEVHVYSKSLKKDDPIDFVTFHEILDEYDSINEHEYDALIVINGSVNFFGGAEDRSQILNYHLINNFTGKVFYILCDPNLMLTQIWPSIEKKEWGHKYNKSDIYIDRLITYIVQPKDIKQLSVNIDKKGIPVQEVIHFPFEKFPLMFDEPKWKLKSERTYDILYGGTFRGGKREDDMIKFYFGYDDDINATMFGKIKDNNFNKEKIGLLRLPNFEKAVKYQEFNAKMSNSISTVIIGDKYYKKVDDLAQRIYESILSGVITFIDIDYDKNRRVYGNTSLGDMLYVKDRKDVIDRLKALREMSDVEFLSLLNTQLNTVNIDILDYAKEFNDIIEIRI